MPGKTSKELVGERLVAKVKLTSYRFPKSGHGAGEFAIVNLWPMEIYEGELPTDLDEDTITATGRMPHLTTSETYILQGVLVIDKQWGPQFQVEDIHLNYNMKDREDQKAFFSFFMTERQAELLFAEYDNPVDLLENKRIADLTKIKGIGPATAMRMCRKYEDCKDNGRAYIELKNLDLTKYAIDKLVQRYGNVDIVVEKVKNNPYILIKEVRGYGWKKADAIALKQGLTRDCKERVQAFTRYFLETQIENNGNSWITVDDLLSNVALECAPVTNENLFAWVKEMMGAEEQLEKAMKDEIKFTEYPELFYERDGRKVSLFSIRLLEKKIAVNLKRLKDAPSKTKFDRKECEKIIEEVEKEQGYTYTDEQKKAIWMILDNNVCILAGSSGTGKTSTLKPVVRILKDTYYKHVEQTALSGRASSLLGEVTGLQGKTIHRLLGFIPDEERFAFNERNHIPVDVIILDETSMVGGDLFLKLISAIEDGSKFIMVGDFKQLESIGECNILKDCLSSGYIASTVLTQIHRQAAKSGIITQSIKASNGDQLVPNDFLGSEVRGELKDLKITCSFDQKLTQYNIIEEFMHLYNDLHIPVEQIQIVVSMRVRGDISCRALNEAIQSIVNGKPTFQEVFVDYMDNGMKYRVYYRPKDRIIIRKNNYHARTVSGKEVAIFNGNMGYIDDITHDGMIIKLKDQENVILEREEWNNIQLAYAITCHSIQGSSAPYVIVGLDYSCYAMFSKEWVYTALTRASKYCVLVTQPKAINQAVKISRVRIKQTWLKQDLCNFFLEEQKGDF